MYRVTGRLQIVRKNKLRERRDGIMELIGYEDILQQEFRCEHYGNIEWRDVPIYTEGLQNRQEAQTLK